MSPCATAVESVRRRQQNRELRAFVQLLAEENRNQPWAAHTQHSSYAVEWLICNSVLWLELDLVVYLWKVFIWILIQLHVFTRYFCCLGLRLRQNEIHKIINIGQHECNQCLGKMYTNVNTTLNAINATKIKKRHIL